MDKIQNVLWQAKFTKKKNWLKAIEILNQALLECPEEIAFMEEIASIYASKKLYKKAIEYYQKILELVPGDSNILFKTGNSYLSLNELNIALYYYEKIPEPFPEAMYNKAIAMGRQGNVDECIEILEKLILKTPDSELPYFFLIEQYLSRKEFEKAIDVLNITESTFGKKGKIYFLRGVAYSYQQNWLKAYVQYDKASKMKYRTAGFLRAYGIAAEKIGKESEAVEHLTASIVLEPFNVSTYLDLINIYISHDRLFEAYKIVEHARQIEPISSALSLIRNKIIQMIKNRYEKSDVKEILDEIDRKE